MMVTHEELNARIKALVAIIESRRPTHSSEPNFDYLDKLTLREKEKKIQFLEQQVEYSRFNSWTSLSGSGASDHTDIIGRKIPKELR